MKIALTDEQIEDLARPLVKILKEFYQNPENETGFQLWLQQREQASIDYSATFPASDFGTD